MTAALKDASAEYKERMFELWTMQCRRHGEVQQSKGVYVERGGRVKVNFNNC